MDNSNKDIQETTKNNMEQKNDASDMSKNDDSLKQNENKEETDLQNVEKSENDVSSTKRKHEQIAIVHSANEWENADLGDEERKNKFLKLMGAGKKEHKGKIVIGDKPNHHARSKEETEQVEDALEGQYKTSLELKLSSHGKRRHIGLGFQNEEEHQEDGNTTTTTATDEEKNLEADDNHAADSTAVSTKTTSKQSHSPPRSPNSLKFGHFIKSDGI